MPIHQCLICGKVLSRSTHLREHARSHTGEKPFACRISQDCTKRFSRPYDRSQHEKIHGPGKHVCLLVQGPRKLGCGKAFHRKGDLKRHLNRDGASTCGLIWSGLAAESAGSALSASITFNDLSEDVYVAATPLSSSLQDSDLRNNLQTQQQNGITTRGDDEILTDRSQLDDSLTHSPHPQRWENPARGLTGLTVSDGNPSVRSVDSNAAIPQVWAKQTIETLSNLSLILPRVSVMDAVTPSPETTKFNFERVTRTKLLAIDTLARNPWIELIWPLHCEDSLHSQVDADRHLVMALTYAMSALVTDYATDALLPNGDDTIISIALLTEVDPRELDEMRAATLLATLVLLYLCCLWSEESLHEGSESRLVRAISGLVGQDGPLTPKRTVRHPRRETICFLSTSFYSFRVIRWSLQRSIRLYRMPINWLEAIEIFNGATSLEHLVPVSGCGLEVPAMMILELALSFTRENRDYIGLWDYIGLPAEVDALKKSISAVEAFNTMGLSHSRALMKLYERTKDLYRAMDTQHESDWWLRQSREILDTIPAILLLPCHALLYQIPLLVAGVVSTVMEDEDRHQAVDLCKSLQRSFGQEIVPGRTVLEDTCEKTYVPLKNDLPALWMKCADAVSNRRFKVPRLVIV